MEENREKSIVNKVVVVTGGSRGIGAQIVKTLANENYKVVLNYNNSKEQAEKIQQELLEKAPEKAEILLEAGMHCLGCPASQAETLEEACLVHGIEVEELIEKLNQD